MDGKNEAGSDVKYGFPAMALCQFCDTCGPQLVLLAIYNKNLDLQPHTVLPRETNCKMCFIPVQPLLNESGVPVGPVDEKLYAALRHSCIYSLTAESPLTKYSTYHDVDGWRLMLHFIVKDIYSRGNVRRMSLVFYSILNRPHDIANISEQMTSFAAMYRAEALKTFEAEKDVVSEWRMQSATSKQQHARNFCQISGVSPERLCSDFVAVTDKCHNMSPPIPCDLFTFDDPPVPDVDFSPLVTLRTFLSSSDFQLLMTKLVQGDQIVVVSASSSSSDTRIVDSLLLALGGLLPSKLAQCQLIGENASAASYADSWQFNLVGLSDLSQLPASVLEEEGRTLVLALKNNSAQILTRWATQNVQKPCNLGKRYTSLFTGAVRYLTEEPSPSSSNLPVVSSKPPFEAADFILIIKAEFVLESKLVYALTRLPDPNTASDKKRQSAPPDPNYRTKKVEEIAQLGPGDLCQALFWASALPGETRRKLVDTSPVYAPDPKNISEGFNFLKELFLH